ncbi:MAG TPA: GntR family transcriptional regulator [Pseudonocardiaceae bacterium]|nr:GntR family transcriptional regulator [Pseudonocardiaceae bacterium]
MAQSSQTGRASRSVLRHLSLPESVHEILRARILNNEIPAGAPLLEVALAEEFGVSRTTIRAAMRELQAERLVEIAPRRGTTVSRMSEADTMEVCFARYALEEIALKGLSRARRRELADQMDDVLAVMDLCAAKGDLAGVVEADTDLHKVIVAASGHPLIVDMWTGLNGQMGALMRSSLDRQKIDLRATVRMHATLITAFREQPAGTVVAALREHYIGHPLEDS